MGGGAAAGSIAGGAIVPTVFKSEQPSTESPPPPPPPPVLSLVEVPPPVAAVPPPSQIVATEEVKVEEEELETDKDVLCPICMQIMKDAFLTSCGHSFCYMCIVTHLQNKSDCPSCANYLTTKQLFPNFLLNKLLMKASARQIAKHASPTEQLRQALQQGCDVSVKELDILLVLLSEKKRKMEQEEAETNLQVMHDFLHCLRKQKLEELKEIQNDLQYIKEDINAVERDRVELNRAKARYSVKLRMLSDDPTVRSSWPSLMDKRNNNNNNMSIGNSVQGQFWLGGAGGSQSNKPADVHHAPLSSQAVQRKDACNNGSDSQNNQPGGTVASKRRVHAQFNDLQECYLQKRRYWARQAQKQEERDCNPIQREGYHPGLKDFQSVLSSFTRYSRLRVVAELRHGDLFHSANIVSSIEFDRDDELFATAGVSRRIKVFEFAAVVNEQADVQCPIVEMPTRSKLSCLSWNKYTKNHLASSDYEGIVTVWDVNTRQSIMEYEEHEKRAWSVDFSRTEPTMLVSGSDDCKGQVQEKLRNTLVTAYLGGICKQFAGMHTCMKTKKQLRLLVCTCAYLKVKIWCTKQEASVLNIDMKANICSVKYNPGSSFHVAVGSADHHIHYYDLRNISQPLHIFSGHRKAISYVKFISNSELASASTDSTLRLWDVKENTPLRTFRGHTNENNFVGLTVNNEYIACGSETNEVFVYHKDISRPAASHRFRSETNEGEEEPGSYFISAVCWKSDSPTMLTANSQGTIKVLVLAA